MGAAIQWNSIRTFKGTQNKCFEQLCFQLAVVMYGSEGRFIEIDDTGGGDGVEFYHQRADGKEWGWRAKFYDQGRMKS